MDISTLYDYIASHVVTEKTKHNFTFLQNYWARVVCLIHCESIMYSALILLIAILVSLVPIPAKEFQWILFYYYYVAFNIKVCG